MLAPGVEPTGEPAEEPRRRSPLVRILIGALIALLIWALLPQLPRDQTVILALGPESERLSQLNLHWETAEGESSEHTGSLTLNFPPPGAGQPTPERIVRQFRLIHGEYVFQVSGVRRDAPARRTEVTRRVTLDGTTVTLRLEELTH